MAKRKAAVPKDDAGDGDVSAAAPAPSDSVYIGNSTGQSPQSQFILLRLANRHGLVTGATGTGKTVTLQGLAEGFSDAGVPVFCADVKGDLSGVSQEGEMKPWIEARDKAIGFTQNFQAYPVIFWDLFGDKGQPIRATISSLGPLLLSRLMDLSEAQEGVLNIAFKIADDEKLPLINLKDLQDLLQNLASRAGDLTTQYGNITKASVGSIQRSLLVLQQQGAEHFFGEPALKISDLMRVARDGRGYISVLSAERLMQSPRLYATFLLFLMSQLFEELPEVGDPDKPKLVFFFDEAHLLFKDAPKALLDKVEQVVRLIRSKGVGVYFVTQNPLDVPDTVLAQLGNRVQHALRAFTPRDQKAVAAAASTMRANPTLDVQTAITELAVGEALVSLLDEKGRPSVTERVFVLPPGSHIGPITPEQRKALIAGSLVAGVYEKTVDRESAYEKLKGRTAAAADAAQSLPQQVPGTTPATPESGGGLMGSLGSILFGSTGPRGGKHEGLAESAARSAVRSVGSAVGREIVRGVLGSLLGGGRRR